MIILSNTESRDYQESFAHWWRLLRDLRLHPETGGTSAAASVSDPLGDTKFMWSLEFCLTGQSGLGAKLIQLLPGNECLQRQLYGLCLATAEFKEIEKGLQKWSHGRSIAGCQFGLIASGKQGHEAQENKLLITKGAIRFWVNNLQWFAVQEPRVFIGGDLDLIHQLYAVKPLDPDYVAEIVRNGIAEKDAIQSHLTLQLFRCYELAIGCCEQLIPLLQLVFAHFLHKPAIVFVMYAAGGHG